MAKWPRMCARNRRQSHSPSIDPWLRHSSRQSPSVMSRISCERLVALVREHPPLYDYSHPAHCNRDVTSGMWAQIATQMGTSEVVCKTKWANLRSNFVRELRRIRPAEDGTMWPPQWPLFKPLMFLLPFLKKRGSAGSGVEEASLFQMDFPEQKTSTDNTTEEPIPYKKIRFECIPAEEEKDDDKLFMLSLVPKMRQLSTIDNVSFRIEVQQLLLNKLCQASDESNVQEAVQVIIQDIGDTDCYEEVIIKEEPCDRISNNSSCDKE